MTKRYGQERVDEQMMSRNKIVPHFKDLIELIKKYTKKLKDEY